MPSRILLAATFFLTLPTIALAQPSAKDRLKSLQTQAPGSEQAQDPTSPTVPLRPLPQLSGKAWRDWIVPDLGVINPGPQQEITTTVSVMNVSENSTTVGMECYSSTGRITYKEKGRTVSANGATRFPHQNGWCRIAADHPVSVVIRRNSRIRMLLNNSSGNPLVTLRDTEIFQAIPYPAE